MRRSPPIAEHRLLSDGRSHALLRPNAEIDWWCWPRVHSTPVCWSLLDENGGAARWLDVQYLDHRERPAGSVARTELRIAGARVETRDALLGCGDRAELVRLVRRRDADLELSHELRLAPFDGELVRWSGRRARFGHRTLWMHGGDLVRVDAGTAHTTVRAERGRWAAIVMTHHEQPHTVAELLERTDAADAAEEQSHRRVRVPKQHANRARDALAVLAACTDRETGAVIAASTTSLPEVVGGDRQFDYRYTWLRDSSSAVTVAGLLGRPELARRYYEFLERLGPDGILGAPLTDADGEPVPEERALDGVAGWSGSRPVRVGNAASEQLQFDAVGMVLDALYVQLRNTRRFGGRAWTITRALADRVAEAGDEESSGIWELRKPRPLVSADIGRWLALDRALRIARYRRPWARSRAWARARDAARARVLGAFRTDGSLPQTYDPGDDAHDASALLLVVYGLLRPTDPRAERLVTTTLAALGSGPLLYRYPPDGRDGFDAGEAPFVPASWWAVTALALLGAPEALPRADALCVLLPALQAEQFDPVRREALGNVPMVWSHAECARALYHLDAGIQRRARACALVRRLRRAI